MTDQRDTSESDEQAFRGRLLALMLEVDRAVGQAPPERQIGVTRGQDLVIRLHAGCRMIFRAIYALIEQKYSEEPRILSRSLLEDALRIGYIFDHRTELERVALEFERMSLKRALGLTQQEKSMGLPGAEARQAEVLESLGAIQDEAQELGSKLRPFPTTAAIISALKVGNLEWYHSVSSNSVHTTRLGLSSRAKDIGEAHYSVIGEGEPGTALFVGLMASQLVGSATIWAADVLGWPEADKTAEAIVSILDGIMPFRQELESLGYLLSYKEEDHSGSGEG